MSLAVVVVTLAVADSEWSTVTAVVMTLSVADADLVMLMPGVTVVEA